MLLFAIGLHAANEQEKSSQVKDVAVEIAIEIGMSREEFAYFGGEKIPEDILMTDDDGGDGMRNDGLDDKRNTEDPVERVDGFRLWMIECSVPLPCEEVEYNNGRIPLPMSLQDFDDRTFSDEPLQFSSYAYRVEAIIILGQVLACGRSTGPDDPRADAADASLVNWALHLPDEKKELVGKDREVDEMLFQAHIFNTISNHPTFTPSLPHLLTICTHLISPGILCYLVQSTICVCNFVSHCYSVD